MSDLKMRVDYLEAERASHGRVSVHTPPSRADVDENKKKEPVGERIRIELEEFLERNRIVGIMMDTEHHCIDISIARLPDRIRSVLTHWGVIAVADTKEDREALALFKLAPEKKS